MANIIKRFYYWFHKKTSLPEERGEPSAGYWEALIRKEALCLSDGVKDKVLEVGCGEGLFLVPFASTHKFKEAYGVDIRPGLLEKVKRRLNERHITNVNVQYANAASLPFPDEYFDLVVCINLIFNLDSAQTVKKILSEIARVSKRKGCLVLDFRNSRNPLLNLKYALAPLYDSTAKKLPLKTYSLEQMRSILADCGFSITGINHPGFFIKSLAPLIVLETEKL
jgi:ubiquinone/menaquinone biosynthesis C-methylase UbiE